MQGGIPIEATQQMEEYFENSPYIGRAQIFDKEETSTGPHKFYYLGFHDVFGVRMPTTSKRPHMRGQFEVQIWSLQWVDRRLPKLTRAVGRAMKGNFIDCRHNAQLKKRAKEHGRAFFKTPQRIRAEAAATEEANRLPIRGRKRKRTKLKI